jgi:hypothetical protein
MREKPSTNREKALHWTPKRLSKLAADVDQLKRQVRLAEAATPSHQEASTARFARCATSGLLGTV